MIALQRLCKAAQGVSTFARPLGSFSGAIRGIKCVACEIEAKSRKHLDQANKEMADALLNGDRNMLGKAASLLENTRKDMIDQSDAFLEYLLSKKVQMTEKAQGPGFHPSSFRIGIAGPPGAGKSTFINSFGCYLTQKQKKLVSVLAIDPSSDKSKGSLLGDKTRMRELCMEPNAYIRPSPSGGILGGVAENTCDLVHLMECSGFDVILVETVGLGQLEVLFVSHSRAQVQVDDMVDMFLLLMPPAMGDGLQGIKKGVMEHADLVVITKADGILAMPAMKTASEQRRALDLQRQKAPHWKRQVQVCSSVANKNIDKVWETCDEFYQKALTSGEMELKRKHQNDQYMWNKFDSLLTQHASKHPTVKDTAHRFNEEMLKGGLTRRRAAMKLLETFLAQPYESFLGPQA